MGPKVESNSWRKKKRNEINTLECNWACYTVWTTGLISLLNLLLVDKITTKRPKGEINSPVQEVVARYQTYVVRFYIIHFLGKSNMVARLPYLPIGLFERLRNVHNTEVTSRSRFTVTIDGHDSRTRFTVTIHRHDWRTRFTVTIHGQDSLSRFTVKILFHPRLHSNNYTHSNFHY